MILSIKELLKEYGITGDIIMYRDPFHKKKGLCEYLKNKIEIKDKTLYTYSDGAFALYLSRALPNNLVKTFFRVISHDYGELMLVQPKLILTYYVFYEEYSEMVKNLVGNYLVIDQYTNPLIKNYYSDHFIDILKEVENYKIDAFCDCGHSCATLAGFIEKNIKEKLVDWKFILGINRQIGGFRKNLWHLEPYKDKVLQYPTTKFDTYEIGDKIEERYPEFGKVFEATRSISAAMAYLVDHPGETVLVYVGDSFEKEGTKFRSSTRAISKNIDKGESC